MYVHICVHILVCRNVSGVARHPRVTHLLTQFKILPQCKYHYWQYTSISSLVLMICDVMPENCDHHWNIVHNVS